MTSDLPLNIIVSPPSAEKGSNSASAGTLQLHDNIQDGGSSRWNPYYYNTLTVENRYLSLLTLIDIAYPPHICTLCDRISPTSSESHRHHRTAHKARRFRCLHPHCELRFSSRAALRYHISRSHLVKQASAQYIIQEPPFMHYKVEPLIGTFPPTPISPYATPLLSVEKTHPTSSSPSSEALINTAYHPLLCPCCNQHFPKKINVGEHLEGMHDGQGPYRCVYPNCTSYDTHYATRDDLVHHILRAHDSSVSSRPVIPSPNCAYRKPLL